tara:strand:+ start:9043 stop:9309 length:267 start_codon:yes stop_codon:yes gene_type:complete
MTTKKSSNSDMLYIKKELKKHGELLERLTTAVVGDETFGQVGLISKVNQHSDYIEADKKFKNKIVGAVSVITTIWGAIIAIVIKTWGK